MSTSTHHHLLLATALFTKAYPPVDVSKFSHHPRASIAESSSLIRPGNSQSHSTQSKDQVAHSLEPQLAQVASNEIITRTYIIDIWMLLIRGDWKFPLTYDISKQKQRRNRCIRVVSQSSYKGNIITKDMAISTVTNITYNINGSPAKSNTSRVTPKFKPVPKSTYKVSDRGCVKKRRQPGSAYSGPNSSPIK
jgi:hypothetical protein